MRVPSKGSRKGVSRKGRVAEGSKVPSKHSVEVPSFKNMF